MQIFFFGLKSAFDSVVSVSHSRIINSLREQIVETCEMSRDEGYFFKFYAF